MGFRRKLLLLGVTAVLVAGAALGLGLSSPAATSPGPPPASTGDQMDRAVPASILDATFTDQEGRPVTLHQFAGKAVFFGIYYQVVREGSPPGIDWQTGHPYTYDVNHSDGFALLDPHQRERFITAGMVRDASMPKSLRRLLDAQGVYDSEHPGGGSWTVDQAFDSILWVLR